MKSKTMVAVLSLSCVALGLIYAYSKRPSYLLRPSGVYGIGYKDTFIINNRLCPDKLYEKDVNEKDFNSDNTQRCHEVYLRIYYPSKHDVRLGEKYYSPPVKSYNRYLAKSLELSESRTQSLNDLLDIDTYAAKAEPVSPDKKFPLIVFMPGAGMSVQMYNNMIGEVVSNGYILIGVNALFASGDLLRSDGHVIKGPTEYKDASRTQSLEDLKLVLERIKDLDYGEPLQEQIDFENMGLLGHSMGAMSLVNLLKEVSVPQVKAMLAMDPGNILEGANYPIQLGRVPSMVMWASRFKQLLGGSVTLGDHSYELILAPTQEELDYSNHQNFSDMATMQYHPALKAPPIEPKHLGVGTANGYEVSSLINEHIKMFFDTYLRQSPPKDANLCEAIDKRLLHSCQ